MKAKKGGGRASEDPDDQARVPLQAILLADSFAQRFRPITLERPKVLLPLVNQCMINYTLEWLESAGVEEVFVFCCAHSKQIIGFLEDSNWFSRSKFSVTAIESHDSTSAGDALRVIYDRHVVHGDFILITGDTVSNMSLAHALQEHKERKKKDSNAIMTMVVKTSKPSPLTHLSRLGTEEIFMGINSQTQQLLYYEDKTDDSKGILSLDKMFFAANTSISFHSDKQDCYIDICSPKVLDLFKDNFDYQHLRRHFVKDVLSNDIMEYKIFTFEIRSSYAARIDNFRSYDTVSKDIIQRWMYPFVPDLQTVGNYRTKLERQAIYKAPDIQQSRSAEVGPSSVVGCGTVVGDNTVILNSVIGTRCRIGSNVSLMGSFIWNDVIIEDGCKLSHAVVCDGVVVKSGAVLEPGVVVSFKAVIGPQFVVPAYSKVSLLLQPTKQDSDDEMEYANHNSGTNEAPLHSVNGRFSADFSDTGCGTESEVGPGGIGIIWQACEGQEEEWKHSVAPIPSDKISKLMRARETESEMLVQDRHAFSLDDSNLKTRSSDFEDSNSGGFGDDSQCFEKEVEDTFLRAVHENVKDDDVILEVNSLRLSYNMSSLDCASAIFYSVVKSVLEVPRDSTVELQRNIATYISKWQKLLKYYIPGLDEEIEVILKLEEMCSESTKEFSHLFSQILHVLYDKDILEEDTILRWAQEKEGADESDKVFLKQSERFIQWLNEASEEED